MAALAALLADARPDDLEPVLARYQALQRARARKIQRSSRVTSRVPGPQLVDRAGVIGGARRVRAAWTLGRSALE